MHQGPIASNTALTSWIKEARVDSAHWLHGEVNSLHYSGNRSAQCKIRLWPPNLGHEHHYKAMCEVTLAPLDEFNGETFPLKMTLSIIEFKKVTVRGSTFSVSFGGLSQAGSLCTSLLRGLENRLKTLIDNVSQRG